MCPPNNSSVSAMPQRPRKSAAELPFAIFATSSDLCRPVKGLPCRLKITPVVAAAHPTDARRGEGRRPAPAVLTKLTKLTKATILGEALIGGGS